MVVHTMVVFVAVLSLGFVAPLVQPFHIPSSTPSQRYYNYHSNPYYDGGAVFIPVSLGSIRRQRRQLRISQNVRLFGKISDETDETYERNLLANSVTVSLTCFLAGISLGAQVAIATTMTTIPSSSFEVIAEQQQQQRLLLSSPSSLTTTTTTATSSTGLLVSDLSLPSLPNFKFGGGGESSSQPVKQPEQQQVVPEPAVSTSNSQSGAVRVLESSTDTNKDGENSKPKKMGGFSLPEIPSFSNKQKEKATPEQSGILPEEVEVIPEPGITTQAVVSPKNNNSNEQKSKGGFSLPDLSRFKSSPPENASPSIAEPSSIPKDIAPPEQPTVIVDTQQSSPASSSSDNNDSSNKSPSKGGMFSLPELSTFKFDSNTKSTTSSSDKQPPIKSDKAPPASQFSLIPGLSNFKFPELPPPITTGPRPQVIAPPVKALFPGVSKSLTAPRTSTTEDGAAAKQQQRRPPVKTFAPGEIPKLNIERPKTNRAPRPERTDGGDSAALNPNPKLPILRSTTGYTTGPKPERIVPPPVPTPDGVEFPTFSLPVIVVPTPEETAKKLSEYNQNRDEAEQARRERYYEVKRQKEIAKEMKIREYDDMFRKEQEERDAYYGKKALENRMGVEELKREESSFIQKGIFSGGTLQPPMEKGGYVEGGAVAPMQIPAPSVPKIESIAPLGPSLAPPVERERFQGQYITPLEERTSAAASRKAYGDKQALRQAQEDVKRLEQRIDQQEKLDAIRAKRLEEEQLVRNRAEVNAMKLQQAKERNAEVRLKDAQELRERQQIKFEAARELREQAEFERRMTDIDKYTLRKEKVEEGKIERSLQK